MTISQCSKYTCLVASFAGIVQGIIWAALSLVVVFLSCRCVIWKVGDDRSTYWKTLNTALVDTYVIGRDEDLYISPLVLVAMSVVYLIATFFWVLLSSILSLDISQKKYDSLKKHSVWWSCMTIAISIVDLGLVGVLIRDYVVTLTNYSEIETEDRYGYSYTVLAVGVVMSLAARGFVLWIVNLIFAIALLCMRMDVPEEKVNGSDLREQLDENLGY